MSTATHATYHPEMHIAAIPRTVDRLFMTSLVLSGILLTSLVGSSFQAFFVTVIINLILALLAAGIMVNHIILYLRAGKQRPDFAPSVAHGKPTGLVGLPNIIFTFIAGLVYIGLMWSYILTGVLNIRSYKSTSTTTIYPYANSGLSELLLGIVGYAEAGVLMTLFALYVRQRRAYLKAMREGTLKA